MILELQARLDAPLPSAMPSDKQKETLGFGECSLLANGLYKFSPASSRWKNLLSSRLYKREGMCLTVAAIAFRKRRTMYYAPRNPEADAKFIEAGGLKSWGCYAFLLCVLVLAILFVAVYALLTNLIGGPAAWWVSLILLSGVVTGVVSLWISRRRRRREAQEQAWQRAMHP